MSKVLNPISVFELKYFYFIALDGFSSRKIQHSTRDTQYSILVKYAGWPAQQHQQVWN